MKIMNALVGSFLLAAVPLAAQAEGMSYSYVDLGYTEIDIDGAPTGDGFGLRGSVGFAENFFVSADYASFSFPGSVDLDYYTVGLGGRIGVSDSVDLVGRAAYAKADASAGGGLSIDDDGYQVSAGARGEVADGFELEGNVIYTDFGSGADDTELAVGARYFFTENFAVGAEFRTGDDAETIFAGVRFAF